MECLTVVLTFIEHFGAYTAFNLFAMSALLFKGLRSPFSLEAKFCGLSPAHSILPHVSVGHSAAVAVLG